MTTPTHIISLRAGVQSSTKAFMSAPEQIPGEPTRFMVQSENHDQCQQCRHTFKRNAEHRCPKCRGHGEPVRYTVDIAAWAGNGGCSCEAFQYTMQPDVERGWNPEPRRCKHIRAARETALDIIIARHLKEHGDDTPA